MISINNKILCKPYTGKKSLQSKVKSGLAEIVQKTQVVGLEVLVEGKLPSGDIVKKGQKIYFSESDLMTFAAFRDIKNCPEISDSDFVVVPSELAVCIK